ncbi:MAG: ABC transporter ATP-binding protein [Bacteroides sp.]|nr:ABC transporter ATP-binding protein [Bacteroides sp.]
MAKCAAIEVKNLSKSYGSVHALKNVDLTVQPGELFGLIGPDGSGKSTLYAILATLLRPDSGSAKVFGLDTTTDAPKLRTMIGYMPERFSLYPDLSVRENLEFFASIFGVEVKDSYPLIAPIFSQLEKFPNRMAGRLSGGMKQKLALSCALIHRPRLLLLDEPTTGVDAVSRAEFWEMLKQLRNSGMTILVTTSYMDEARLCDRIALINDGHIGPAGNPADLLQSSANSGSAPNSIQDGVPAIAVENLTKKFGDFAAVNNISFSVGKGEIFGFLGANGAGKTTAMRMLCGLSRPTSGSGTVIGFDINTQPEEIKRNIGYMSQRFSLYDQMTVEENLRLFATIYGLSAKEFRQRVNEIYDSLDMRPMANTLVRDIPTGWRQKLAFAASTIHKPELLFLDEPTGGVDPESRKKFWDIIYQAAKDGMTIFVTTHYLDEADFCNRVSIMVDGQIAALDTPESLKQRYNAKTFDEVFRIIASSAKRSE